MSRSWQLTYSSEAQRDLNALDRSVAKRLIAYLTERILPLEDPRSVGKALAGSRLGNYWRYRCGNYRIIVDIIDRDLIIVA